MPLPLNVPALNSNVMNNKRILRYTQATGGISHSSCLYLIWVLHADHRSLLQVRKLKP